MKRITLIICYIVSTTAVFGQQFLWSTDKETSMEHVPLENVTNEVLKFYDHYEFYYDGAGYSKNGFFSTIEKYGDATKEWNDFKERIKAVEDLRVYAFRGNLGQGSVVLVFSVSKDNVNFVGFSNNYESDAILTREYERDKFVRWFQTLLN